MSEVRKRSTAIIIRNDKVLFGIGKYKNKVIRFFIGGGPEVNETAQECLIREIKEEINVDGKIIFEFELNRKSSESIFLVDIGDQIEKIGYDPEEFRFKLEDRMLQQLKWIDLNNAKEFNNIDKEYLNLLYLECNKRKYNAKWLNKIKIIIENKNKR